MSKYTMGTKGYTDLLGDIRRTNNYILRIDGVTNDNALELLVDRAFIPSLEIGVITLTHGNDSKTYAGQATWSGGQVTINDTLSTVETDALDDWIRKVYDSADGSVGLARDYKKEATLTEYAGNMQHQRSWEFTVWPSSINYGELDASNANMKQITMTLQVDPPKKIGATHGIIGVGE